MVSGGQGSDERVSEAEAMASYLTGRGIPEDHVVREDQSRTTEENLTFSQAIMEACLKASNEVNAETSATNPDFKKIYDSQMAFRDDLNLWWQVAEYSYETFMIRTRPKG